MFTLLTLVAAVGMSHLLVDASIFAKLRGYLLKKKEENTRLGKDDFNWAKWTLELMSCYQCSGFWTGALMGLVFQPISWDLSWYFALPLWLIVTPFIFGCAASFLSMVGSALLNYLDAPAMLATVMKKKNDEPKA